MLFFLFRTDAASIVAAPAPVALSADLSMYPSLGSKFSLLQFLQRPSVQDCFKLVQPLTLHVLDGSRGFLVGPCSFGRALSPDSFEF